VKEVVVSIGGVLTSMLKERSVVLRIPESPNPTCMIDLSRKKKGESGLFVFVQGNYRSEEKGKGCFRTSLNNRPFYDEKPSTQRPFEERAKEVGRLFLAHHAPVLLKLLLGQRSSP